MSDLGRKDISDKVGSKLKPDSEKSTPEHFKDKVTDKVDDVVGGTAPDEQKSWTQQASDAVFGEKK